VVDVRTDLRTGANEDTIATDIRRRPERIMRTVNLYEQNNTQSGERPARKLNGHGVIWQAGTVLAGDINAYSKRWNPSCRVQLDAAFWEGVINLNGPEIGNDGRPNHHWTTEDQEGDSVIDLKLPNRPIVRWTLLTDDHATGSDHVVLEWQVGVDRQKEAGYGRVVGWNVAAMTEEDMETGEKLWMELASNRTQQDVECTEDEVEQETA